MVSLPNSYRYSLQWSQNVVRDFHRKYARATESFCDFAAISTKQLSYLLAMGRPEWIVCRNLIKTWHEWHKRSPWGTADLLGWANILHVYSKKMPPRMLSYLDSRLESHTIKEQRNRGDLEAESAEGSLPMSSEFLGGPL